MPELPEVETIRARLAPIVTGASIEAAEILDARLVRPLAPRAVEAALEGERFAALGRRGKYLVFRFESGRVLLAHLRMTGSFRHGPAGSADGDPYVRAVLRLDNGADVTYRDVRRFGTWLVLDHAELEPYLAERVGEEPLGEAFTADALARRLAGRRAPVKSALLDQRAVAGLGNIYADEALWRARVNPLIPAGELGRGAVGRLRTAIRDALLMGLAREGASLRDYRTPSGERGAMQEAFEVYGRTGEPCSRCGRAIARTRIAGRGTWFCPRCQRPRR